MDTGGRGSGKLPASNFPLRRRFGLTNTLASSKYLDYLNYKMITFVQGSASIFGWDEIVVKFCVALGEASHA